MSVNLSFSLALFASTGLSIALLVLAMPRHYAVLVGETPNALRAGALKWGGWFMMVVSLVIALAQWNGGISLMLWTALLGFHSFTATMVVTYAARSARAIVAGNILALVFGLFGLLASP